ncbi:TetR/AcrR family transcriptional regulator [Kitasatospora indigofera]|uniref:TetR/AcrR family transcriptional regulator n=1 Tax=Kitasatospora indigofera TaxID=67307 RepID=UPI0036765A23
MTPTQPAGPRRSRLKAEERRASILAAAIEVFAEHGYQRGKVSAVAARLGVTEPVVFQNFGSKAALFAATVDLAAEQICSEFAGAAAAGFPAGALLAEITSPAHLDHLHAQGSIGVLFADASSSAEPVVAQAGQAAVRRIAETIAGILRLGQAAGDVRPGPDPDAAAWLLVSLISARPLREAAIPDGDRQRLEGAIAAMAADLLLPPAD